MKYSFSNFFRGFKKNRNGNVKSGNKNLDKKLVLSLCQSRFPSPKQIKHLPKFLSDKETKTMKAALFFLVVSILAILGQLYFMSTVKVPAFGGEYTEALVGSPRFLNPLFSETNDVDRDLSRLIFSSLLKYDSRQNIVEDLAKSYEISEDQKTYTIYLRDDVSWHDGEKLTADDVIFTVMSITDPEYKSPLYQSLRGVTVDKINDYAVAFRLEEPFAPFLEILTFGILPKHIWEDIPAGNANLAEFNIKPIGSGAYKFSSFSKDKLGNVKALELLSNENYYGNRPFIKTLVFKFYPDFISAVDALKNKNVEGVSFLPKELKRELGRTKNLAFYSLQIPQYTAIFFNQTKNEALKEAGVRQALALATPKDELLREVLHGEGITIDGPILPGYLGYNPDIKKYPLNLDEANKLLDESSWKQFSLDDYRATRTEEEKKKLEEKKKAEAAAVTAANETVSETENENKTKETVAIMESLETNETTAGEPEEIPEETQTEEKTPEEIITEQIEMEIEGDQPFFRKNGDKILTLTLATVDQPENLKAAEIIKNNWKKLGIKVNLNIISPSDIRRSVIKDRNYEALLYAEILGSDPDPYPFWHSSQNQHPGLNLAVFTNRRVDTLLEEARQTNKDEERQAKYLEFQNILAEGLPAIFLYSPTYTYVVNTKVKNVAAERLSAPADRFAAIENWYIITKRKFK